MTNIFSDVALYVRFGVSAHAKSLGDLWFRLLPHLVAGVFFGDITVRNAERIPRTGPVLFIGLHRNGAADGWAYAAALPRPVTFMVAAQILRHPVARLMARGIEVVRDKDQGGRGGNLAAREACLAQLAGGNALFVFPEGTSTLGPRHLPFKPGAAWLAAHFAARHGELTVIPLAIHWAAPAEMGGDIDIVVGDPMAVRAMAGVSAERHVEQLLRRFTSALEATGCEFADAETQRVAERLASIGAGGGVAYSATLRACSQNLPPSLKRALQELDGAFGTADVAPDRERQVGGRLRALGGLVVGLPGGGLATAGLLVNVPPVLAGWIAGCRLADAANTVTLWRIMVGLPILLLWGALILAAAIVLRSVALPVAWLALTLSAARLQAPARRRVRQGWIALRRPQFLHLHRKLEHDIADYVAR